MPLAPLSPTWPHASSPICVSIYAPETDYRRTSSLFYLPPPAQVAAPLQDETTEQMKSGGQYTQNLISDVNLLVYAVIFVAGETFYVEELRAGRSVEPRLWERQTETDCILFIWGFSKNFGLGGKNIWGELAAICHQWGPHNCLFGVEHKLVQQLTKKERKCNLCVFSDDEKH